MVVSLIPPISDKGDHLVVHCKSEVFATDDLKPLIHLLKWVMCMLCVWLENGSGVVVRDISSTVLKQCV